MNNTEFSEKLAALFPTKNIELRIAIVALLKDVLLNSKDDPKNRFEFSLGGFEHFRVFKQELLNQPVLLNELFPNKIPREIERELSSITSGARPSMNSIYSMIASDLVLETLVEESDEGLAHWSQKLAEFKLTFIYKLINQEDAAYIQQ